MDAMKFCTGCQCHRPVEGGMTRRCRNTARWMCRACAERKSESIYKRQGDRPADIGRIMKSLGVA